MNFLYLDSSLSICLGEPNLQQHCCITIKNEMWSFQNVQGYLCPGFREGSYHLWDPFSMGNFWCNLLAISLLIQCTFLSGPIQPFSFHGILPLPVSCDFVGNCPILLRCNLFFMVFSLPIPNSHSTSDALLRLTCPLELVSFLFSHLIHRYWVLLSTRHVLV